MNNKFCINNLFIFFMAFSFNIISSCRKAVDPGDWNVHWPIIDFTVSPKAPIVGDTINLRAIEKDGSSDVVSWEWDLDDSTIRPATENSISFVYDKVGKYHIRLKATDASGYTAFANKDITVAKDTGILIKVMMFYGKPYNNYTEAGYQKFADVINKYKPDLVIIREIDSSTSRNHGINAPKFIAEKTNMHYFFGKAFDYGGGAYGSTVLSRYPIVDGISASLASDPSLGGSNRGLALARVQLDNKEKDTLVIAGGKLDTQKDDAGRLYQINSILSYFQKYKDYPGILGECFNGDLAGDDVFNLLKSRFTLACPADGCPVNYPKSVATRTYDFILYKPSDHFLLIRSYSIDAATEIVSFKPVMAELRYFSK